MASRQLTGAVMALRPRALQHRFACTAAFSSYTSLAFSSSTSSSSSSSSSSSFSSAAAPASPVTADVAIVGAGVIGCSIALHLARSGRRVVVVDAEAGAGQGSTSYSSGICRPFYSLMDSVKFACEGYAYWRDWEEFIGVHDPRGYAKLRPCGGLILRSPGNAAFLGKCLPIFDELGVVYEEWDAATLAEKMGEGSKFGMDLRRFGPPKRIDHDDFGMPQDGEAPLEGAVFVGETGYVSDPQLGTMNMAFAAEATGNATFLYRRKVTAVRKRHRSGGNGSSDDLSDFAVTGLELDGGDGGGGGGAVVHAPIVINAAGPHSSLVTAMAYDCADHDDARKAHDRERGLGFAAKDMTVTTKPLRQEVAYLPGQGYGGGDRTDGAGSGPVVTDFDTGAYFRPEVGDKLLVGGLEPDCDELHWCDTPEDGSPSLSEEHTNFLYRAALRMPRLPLGTPGGAQGIVAFYDVTEDWTPIYDRSAINGYYMAIGTSGNQFKNAGVAGKMMTELVEGVEDGRLANHDEQPLQFELTKTRMGTINTGTFSRKRDVLSTSGSVMG